MEAPIPILTGRLVRLRPARVRDAPLIASFKRDPLVRRMALDPDTRVTVRGEREDLRRAVRSTAESYLVIETLRRPRAVGYVRLNSMDSVRRTAWLRFALGAGRGRGYMKDALRTLLDALFARGLHRVEGEVYARNVACLGLLRSLGFRREGTKRQAHFDGRRWLDIHVLARLASPDRAKRPGAILPGRAK